MQQTQGRPWGPYYQPGIEELSDPRRGERPGRLDATQRAYDQGFGTNIPTHYPAGEFPQQGGHKTTVGGHPTRSHQEEMRQLQHQEMMRRRRQMEEEARLPRMYQASANFSVPSGGGMSPQEHRRREEAARTARRQRASIGATTAVPPTATGPFGQTPVGPVERQAPQIRDLRQHEQYTAGAWGDMGQYGGLSPRTGRRPQPIPQPIPQQDPRVLPPADLGQQAYDPSPQSQQGGRMIPPRLLGGGGFGGGVPARPISSRAAKELKALEDELSSLEKKMAKELKKGKKKGKKLPSVLGHLPPGYLRQPSLTDLAQGPPPPPPVPRLLSPQAQRQYGSALGQPPPPPMPRQLPPFYGPQQPQMPPPAPPAEWQFRTSPAPRPPSAARTFRR